MADNPDSVSPDPVSPGPFSMDRLQSEFPIPSQTTVEDKRVLLGLRETVRARGPYSVLEIGSYLGGSLTPFLGDPACRRILSVDSRERALPDSRGMRIDYRGVTHETMLQNLQNAGFATDRVETHDGSISDISRTCEGRFDFVFIDGEHTDPACFRDFIHAEKLRAPNAIFAFHDSILVCTALQNILEYLNGKDERFLFFKVRHSEISVLAFDELAALGSMGFAIEEDLDRFFEEAENRRLLSVVRRRVGFGFRKRKLLPGFVLRDMPTERPD